MRRVSYPASRPTRRPTTRGERRHEHAVAAMPMRPQAVAVGAAVRAVGSPIGLEVGAMAEERVAGGVGLGPRERAHRVDQPAAGPQQVGRRRSDRHLESREAGQVGSLRRRHRSSGRRRAEPMPLHGASTSTRSNGPAQRPARVASCATTSRAQPEPAAALRDQGRRGSGRTSAATTRPASPDEARGDARPCRPAPAQASRMRSPGAGSSARDDEGGGLVLDGEPPSANPGRSAGSPPSSSEAVRIDGRRPRDRGPRRGAPRPAPHGRPGRVTRRRQRRRVGERRGRRLRLVVADEPPELVDRPRGEPGAHGDRLVVGPVAAGRWIGRERRSTALTKPRSRGPARSTVSATAACGGIARERGVGTRRAGARARARGHPRRPAAIARRSIARSSAGAGAGTCRTRAPWRTRGRAGPDRERAAGAAARGWSTRRRRSPGAIASEADRPGGGRRAHPSRSPAANASAAGPVAAAIRLRPAGATSSSRTPPSPRRAPATPRSVDATIVPGGHPARRSARPRRASTFRRSRGTSWSPRDRARRRGPGGRSPSGGSRPVDRPVLGAELRRDAWRRRRPAARRVTPAVGSMRQDAREQQRPDHRASRVAERARRRRPAGSAPRAARGSGPCPGPRPSASRSRRCTRHRPGSRAGRARHRAIEAAARSAGSPRRGGAW